MGKLAYSFAIYCYGIIILLASLFSKKAALFTKGRRDIWNELHIIYPKENVVWFHAASLGEFEQGKPVMEELLKKHPHLNLILTFFSPSGYEIRKDYNLADVFYLPLDTPVNAKKFIKIVNPKLAVFIRYEFWANYLSELYKNHIPTTVISAQFRANQFAFSALGGFIKSRIQQLDSIMVQYESAGKVLLANGVDPEKIHVCGDSRFDRVMHTAQAAEKLEVITDFKGDAPLLILGSCYQHEEAFIREAYAKFPDWKFLYAPHFVDDKYIKNLRQRLPGKANLYTDDKLSGERILVLNTIGKLAAAYRYGNIAVVGGGFRDGIHNIIEPMAFGLPTFFGPNHRAFPEAEAAIKAGIAFEIDKNGKSRDMLYNLMGNPDEVYQIKSKTLSFVSNASGATQHIVKYLEPFL